MSLLSFRRGQSGDEDWLFRLFRTTMQDHIDRAWGWEELLQHEGFVTTLPAREFQILEAASQPVGCYHLSDKGGHLLLDIIMVEPDCQGQGHGRFMMQAILRESLARQLPVRLRVLQTNPAVAFHRHLGFVECGRDQHSLEMIWQPDAL